jgi:hypothetical protein
MLQLRWGARDHLGAVLGEDGRRQVGDAFRNRHREEEFVLTPKKRPGPALHPCWHSPAALFAGVAIHEFGAAWFARSHDRREIALESGNQSAPGLLR